MSLDENVVLEVSKGGDCGICDRKIEREEYVIRVRFAVPVVVTSVKIDREIHFECAEELSKHLKRKLLEAGWK